MTAFWRQAGLNYVQYSQICARIVRQVLKADLKEAASKRDQSFLKMIPWKDGKPIKTVEP